MINNSAAVEDMNKNVKSEVTASSRRNDLDDKKKQRRTLDNSKKLNMQVECLITSMCEMPRVKIDPVACMRPKSSLPGVRFMPRDQGPTRLRAF
jgi:hypothetical protein